MSSNSEWDSPSPVSPEEEAEMTKLAEVHLLNEITALRKEKLQLLDRVERFRALSDSSARRAAQLEVELEACRNNLQELNLLDGFLRSGAIRTLNLDNEPGLRDLLTTFLGRALQTALDSKAIQFPTPRARGD